MKKIFVTSRDILDKKKKYFKEEVDSFDTAILEDINHKEANYNLYNNKLDEVKTRYLTHPLGTKRGRLPAKLKNWDISATKLDVMLGMAMRRPEDLTILATNREATTRKEEEEFGRVKQFIIDSMVAPKKKELLQQRLQQESEKGEVTQQQKLEIQKQVDAEIEKNLPPKVKKYMSREHQDPSEIQAVHLNNYFTHKHDLKRKFNACFKHGIISGWQIMFTGIIGKREYVDVIHPGRVRLQMLEDSIFVHKAERIEVQYNMTPSQVIEKFGSELSKKDVEKLYDSSTGHNRGFSEDDIIGFEEFLQKHGGGLAPRGTIQVYHRLWRVPKRIAFLSYVDLENPDKGIQSMIVDDSYTLNYEGGDVEIEYRYITQIMEGWKIGKDIYAGLGVMKGQHRDINDLSNSNMPYYGVVYDMSPMDKMINYQMSYNIAVYKINLLMASDKGKRLISNINMIPKKHGYDLGKWLYFAEASGNQLVDPNAPGNKGASVVDSFKVADLSLASQIDKYVQYAENIRIQCGRVVGVTEGMEGMTDGNQSVGNNQRNVTQSSFKLEPYFNLHTHFKKEVRTALLEAAKVVYEGQESAKLSYVLDDTDVISFKLDINMLRMSTLGIFVSNTAKIEEALASITNLAHAAMQAQKIDLSEVLELMTETSLVTAKEKLKLAEEKKREEARDMQDQQAKALQEEQDKAREHDKLLHEQAKELVILKETERRQTEIEKATLMASSFNPQLLEDGNDNGKGDYLDVIESLSEKGRKDKELRLKSEDSQHNRNIDKEKLKIEHKKLDIQKSNTK